jgi:hypothetical protein
MNSLGLKTYLKDSGDEYILIDIRELTGNCKGDRRKTGKFEIRIQTIATKPSM